MSNVMIKNQLNRPIVCSLDSDETLRLLVGEEKSLKEEEITNHLTNLEKSGKITITQIEPKKVFKKTSERKTEVEEKKED